MLDSCKGFKMNVTSTTQTQYAARNKKIEESTSTEYKTTTDVVS